MDKKTKRIIWIVIAVAVVLISGFWLSDYLNSSKTVTFDQFLKLLESGKINQLYIDGYSWTGRLIENGRVVGNYAAIGPSLYDYESIMAFIQDLGVNASKVQIEFVDPNAGSIW